MKRHPSHVLAAIVLPLGLLIAGCAGNDRQQARERIEALQAKWVEAVADGDVDTIVNLYAEDAWFLPAGSKPLQGRAAIRAYWEETLADPPWQQLAFGPTDIRFSEGGDVAIDVGSSRTVVAADGGESVQKGKYLIVWRRIDGEWRVVADAFNGN